MFEQARLPALITSVNVALRGSLLLLALDAQISMSQTASSKAATGVMAAHAGNSRRTLTDTLRLDRVLVAGHRGAMIHTMAIVGKTLVAGSKFISPHLIVYRLPEGDIVAKLAPDGSGPGQLKSPMCITSYLHGGTFTFTDQDGRKFFTVNMVGSTGAHLLGVVTIEKIIPDCAFRMGDRILISAGFPDRVLYHTDMTGHIMSDEKVAPPFPGEVPYNYKAAALNPNGSSIAVAYHWINRLEVYDSLGHRIRQFAGPSSSEPRFDQAYQSLAVTSHYIYASYCGCDPTAPESQKGTHTIHVFSWNGEFVGQFTVDKGIFAFAVSQDDATLYASFGDTWQDVGEWRLPRLAVNGGGH